MASKKQIEARAAGARGLKIFINETVEIPGPQVKPWAAVVKFTINRSAEPRTVLHTIHQRKVAGMAVRSRTTVEIAVEGYRSPRLLRVFEGHNNSRQRLGLRQPSGALGGGQP